MGITKMQNMINPEVMGDMIDAKIEAQLKLTPYAKLDTTLEGVAGDTKTVASWNYVGDAVEVAEGQEVELSEMTTATEQFTVKKIMKSIGLTEESVISGLGNPIGQAEKQLGKSIAGKIDTDVLEATYGGKVIYAPSTLAAISYAGIVGAVAQFEDEEDGIEKVMFIHPAQEAALLLDPQFTSADKFTAGVAVNGSIGKVAGCWVKKSSKVRHIEFEKNAEGSITIVAEDGTESSTAKKLSTVQPFCAAALKVGDKVNAVTAANQYYLNPIIKMEPDSEETEYTEDELPAITIFLKRNIKVSTTWIARKEIHEITASKHYGVALTNGAKIVLAKFKK